MSFGLLFPGQGSHYAGFLHALPDVPAVRETLQESSDYLGHHALALDEEVSLASTVPTQLALLIAGVAFSRFLISEQLTPDATAGMSVGAFAAAVTAASLSFPSALRLVRRRAELMHAAFPDGSHGMAVIEGLQLATLSELLSGSALSIANYNSPIQFVIAGKRTDLEALTARASLAGAHTAKLLRMAVPSHTDLLLPAAQQLSEFARDVPVLAPRINIFSNRTARPLASAEAVREDLIFNMAHPVLWHDIATALAATGAALLLEAPPGRTLTQLNSVISPTTRALAADGMRWDVLARAARAA